MNPGNTLRHISPVGPRRFDRLAAGSGMRGSPFSGFPLPKPPQGRRKIPPKVEGPEDALISPLSDGGVGVRGQVEHSPYRAGDVLAGRGVDEEPGDTLLDLVDKPA